MRFILSALLLLFPLLSSAIDEGDLLEPEKAFVFSARVLDANSVEVRYQIAEGYSLYRDKFKFEVQPAEVTLGAMQLPPGKIKQDETFGRVEIYRHAVAIKLPLTRTATGAQVITLKSTAQGCADAGVCYPPLTQSAKLNLPATMAAPVTPPSSGLPSLQQLGIELGGANDFLPPEQAFKLSVSVRDGRTLLADFKPAASYYLYRDKIHFTLKSPDGAVIEKVDLPAGETKSDPNFGKMQVYHQPFQAVIRLKPGASGKVTLQAVYQGCSEKGICYPPINKTFALKLPDAGKTTAAQPQQPVTAPEAIAPVTTTPAVAALPAISAREDAAPAGDDSSRLVKLLQTGNFWLVVAGFFGAGLLLSMTPCVFPMIPILSGIIVGQGHQLTKGRAMALSIAYVLGMAVTYAAAGVAAGLAGGSLSAALQSPYVLSAFALMFVALAFSMFGFYEIQLPSFLQSKVTDASNRMQGGTLTGVFVMGALSALIVGPCVAPPLAGALGYISLTRDMWLGGAALFAMALGMGVPLLVVGASGGALLPKAGDWMTAVKSVFGVIMLGLAIWLVAPIISDLAQMLLWAALLIVSAIYVHALDPLPQHASGFRKFWKGVGVIALICGVALLIGVLSGSRDMLQPLAGLRASSAGAAAANPAPLKFDRVASVAELERRIQQSGGKYVMLDFFADWCVSCKEFERFTFNDPRVHAELKDVVLLQADVTANSEEDKQLLKKFGLFGPPGLVFFDRSGKEIKPRVVGYEDPEKFLKSLDAACIRC